jgi:CBS domain-containing protein
MSDVAFQKEPDAILAIDADVQLGTVGSVMERGVVTLRLDQPLGEAARVLERSGVSGAPVKDGDRVVGMVSLADLFRAAGIRPEDAATSGPWHRHEHVMSTPGRTVADAMSVRVVTVPPEAPLAYAAALMRLRGVNRIPVVTRLGELVGIVARDDIIEAVATLAINRVGHHPGGSSMVPD